MDFEFVAVALLGLGSIYGLSLYATLVLWRRARRGNQFEEQITKLEHDEHEDCAAR